MCTCACIPMHWHLREVRGQLCGVCSLHLYKSSGDSKMQAICIRVYQRNRSNGVNTYYVIAIKPASVNIVALVPKLRD